MNKILVHAYIKIENAEYPVFDIKGPGNLRDVLERFPNSGDTAEIPLNEKKVLSMAYTTSSMPNIDAVMPFARELIGEWQEEFAEVLRPHVKPETGKRKRFGAKN